MAYFRWYEQSHKCSFLHINSIKSYISVRSSQCACQVHVSEQWMSLWEPKILWLYRTVLVYIQSLGSLIILVMFFYAAEQQVPIISLALRMKWAIFCPFHMWNEKQRSQTDCRFWYRGQLYFFLPIFFH